MCFGRIVNRLEKIKKKLKKYSSQFVNSVFCCMFEVLNNNKSTTKMEQGKTLITRQTVGTTYKSVVNVYWFCDEELGIYSKSYINHYGDDVTRFYNSAKAVATAYERALKNQ